MNMGIYYTYQHEDAWKVALERGYLQGDPHYALFNDEGFDFFKPAYDWMVEQYEQRIGISLNGNYPVWCWDEFPDLSIGGHIGQGNKGVVLTVELPDDDVLPSELSYWHLVLGQSAIYDTIEAYDTEEEAEPAYTRKSWEKIFDQEWCEVMAANQTIAAPSYQYVIHRIELHHVRAVMPFQDLSDSWVDRIRGSVWRLGYRLGLKKSIPFQWRDKTGLKEIS
ncbi:DUF3841 domain-containing protein [Exiguobacterium sp. s36]|uniref:DUF3841 domain-containing protein n=1 Tax=Exiguobacterium sp. s36 TaxID=2751227 RepID=UPI001BE5D7FE|nr:DUF3841 domain-containing protein [Exiguobacterium sp. s36]